VGTPASTVAGKRRARAASARRRAAPGRASGRSRRKPSPKPSRGARSWRLVAARLPRLGRRGLLLAAVAAALAIGYFAWFRDSSLVAIREVRVEGVKSADRQRIVTSLTRAARGMTTLHLQLDRLRSAVRGLPTVASVRAETSFPHGLTIQVTERRPALVAVAGRRAVPVAADGSVLPGAKVEGPLPRVRVDSAPASGRLSGEALATALVVGAAPTPLRPLIDGAAASSGDGVVVTIRGGIRLRFGAAGRREAKWDAAAAVLADPELTELAYVDLRAPERPAAGGTSAPSPAITAVTSAETPVTGAP
jgi:cell division protein FtsQ